jgi:hypothetical protein
MNAMKMECEAIERYRELEAWFTDRNYDDLASLCARLAVWHRDVYVRIGGQEGNIAADTTHATVPWVARDRGAKPYEFLWRLASPAQLLELALKAEHSEACVAKLRAAIRKIGPVNWEAALESGAAPSLALGGERRTSR